MIDELVTRSVQIVCVMSCRIRLAHQVSPHCKIWAQFYDFTNIDLANIFVAVFAIQLPQATGQFMRKLRFVGNTSVEQSHRTVN